MRLIELIEKKKRGGELTDREIEFFVRSTLDPHAPDYQLAALLMAIRLIGMTDRETVALTHAMARSGDMLNLSAIDGVPVDKHSTGGVGDTTSLILVPLVAACGAPVAKMSGRGLGFTGGTLDKLDSIPGFRHDLTPEEFIATVQRVGCAIAGQSPRLAPADKRLYALRDVTGTVDSLPLIVSSILSKKLAAGARAIALDVKTGSGAIMEREEDALELARTMVRIGNAAGRNVTALVTDMSQPLGMYIGNALEVEEAILALRGEVSGPLMDVVYALGAQMLLASGVAANGDDAAAKLRRALESGAGLQKLADMIAAQGGDPRVVENTALLPGCAERIPVPAPRAGYVTGMVASQIGIVSMMLGAGRIELDDKIDLGVGLILKVRNNSPVEKGEPLAELRVNSRANLEEAQRRLLNAISIGDRPGKETQIIKTALTGEE